MLGGGSLFSYVLRMFVNCCRLSSFPFLKLKMPQFSNLSISQVIQKAEFAYVDLRFTLHRT